MFFRVFEKFGAIGITAYITGQGVGRNLFRILSAINLHTYYGPYPE
jgi:hypothetical protein